ncbi:MAG: hypothetical protein AB1894_13615 [Chloroflexota bacterium]
MRKEGILVGDAVEIGEQIALLGEAGAQRVMLQWLDLDDLAGLEALAKVILV